MAPHRAFLGPAASWLLMMMVRLPSDSRPLCVCHGSASSQVSEIIQRRASDSGLPMGGTARAGAAVLERLGGKATKKADGPVLSKSE